MLKQQHSLLLACSNESLAVRTVLLEEVLLDSRALPLPFAVEGSLVQPAFHHAGSMYTYHLPSFPWPHMQVNSAAIQHTACVQVQAPMHSLTKQNPKYAICARGINFLSHVVSVNPRQTTRLRPEEGTSTGVVSNTMQIRSLSEHRPARVSRNPGNRNCGPDARGEEAQMAGNMGVVTNKQI